MGWTTKISGAHSRPGSRAADTLSLLSQDRQTVTTRTHARVRATPGTRRRHRACIALHAQPKAVLPVTPSGFAHVTARRVTRSQQATAPATAAHPACSCDRRCRTRTVPAAHAAAWRPMRPAADDLARLRKLEMVAHDPQYAAPPPPCAIAVARSCAPTAEEHSCRCGRRRALSTGRSPAVAPLTLLRSDLAARSLSPLARTRILARFVRPPWPRRWAAWLSAAARPFTVFLPPVFGCFVASWRARARQASVLGLASARAL